MNKYSLKINCVIDLTRWCYALLLCLSIQLLATAQAVPSFQTPFDNPMKPTNGVPDTDDETEAAPAEVNPRAEFITKLDSLGKDFSTQDQLLTDWLAKNPNDGELRFRYAQVLSWQGKYQVAFQEYQRLTLAYPTDVDYMVGYAQTYIWAQQPKKALPLLQEAKKIKPMYSEIYHTEIQAYEQLNDRKQLESTVEMAKVIFPKEEWKVPPKEKGDVRPMEFDTGYSAEHLGNGFKAWNGQYFSFKKPFTQRAGVYTRFDRTNRFSLQDFQLTGGGYFPITKKFSGVVEGTVSPTNYVLPKWSGYAEINRSLPYGFVVHAGYKHSEYRDAISESGIYTLENYWKHWRTAYTLYNSYLHQSGWANSHVGQIEYTYGKHENTVSLTGSIGQELTNLGPRGVLATDVHALFLSGIQWVHPRFGITYLLGVQRQGDLYTRKGGQLGVKYLL